MIITQESRIIEVHAGVEIDFDQLDAAIPFVDTVVDEKPSITNAQTPSDIDVDTPTLVVESNKRPSPPVVTAKPIKKYKREEKGNFLFIFST